MKIHEFQAKAILSAYGVPVPRGEVVTTPVEARSAAERLGGAVVLKAQIHAGGRGKAGGVMLASSPQAAEVLAERLIGACLVTHQTGLEGKIVKRILVEEQLAVSRELYVGVVLDHRAVRPVIMVSAVEIGRASCRERVYISVVAVSLKKK